jgi:hypothetical protein
MKTKQNLIGILMLMMILLVQASCSDAKAACPAPTSETKLLTNTEAGYCLLYPAEYSTTVPNYIVINPITAAGDAIGEAWMYTSVTPAGGRTAAQIVDKDIAALGEGFNITQFEVDVDGEKAIVVDGLPAQDSARYVFIVHDDQLYNLIFMPWYPNATEPTALENLYTMVMDTFRFIPGN